MRTPPRASAAAAVEREIARLESRLLALYARRRLRFAPLHVRAARLLVAGPASAASLRAQLGVGRARLAELLYRSWFRRWFRRTGRRPAVGWTLTAAGRLELPEEERLAAGTRSRHRNKLKNRN